jgi:hypothetical protein
MAKERLTNPRIIDLLKDKENIDLPIYGEIIENPNLPIYGEKVENPEIPIYGEITELKGKVKPITPITKIGHTFTFQSVLKDKNNYEIDDLELAVQYFDYSEAKWVTIGTSKTEEGIFKLNYADKLGVFSTMPLFRLANNQTSEIYQYGATFTVKIARTRTTSTVDFGEIMIVDKSLANDLPTDGIDDAVLVGIPCYLANYFTEKTEEPNDIFNSNPNAVMMPNLIGYTETACSQILLSYGLKLDPIYQYTYTDNENIINGQSVKQSVIEGHIVNRGEIITVLFAKKSITK